MNVQNYFSSGGSVNIARATHENANGFGHKDYRLLENRREGFLQWWVTSTAALDVDPSMWMMRYLSKRFEYSIEERLWFAWLFHTYLLPTTWCLKQEFPDEELASVERFEVFVNENYPRLRHERDTKWSRGHLAAMYASYHGWVGCKSQEQKFNELCQSSPEENFKVLWKEFNGLFKIGRYTAFFLLQTYKQTCDIPIECPSLFLSDYEGSKSHRNGLCLAANREDWINQRLTAAEYQWLEGFGRDLIVEASERWPVYSEQFDGFTLETVACSYKKLWRTANGRYINYYNDRTAEQIRKAEGDGWHGIEWNVLHQCRAECSKGRLKPTDSINKDKMTLFMDTGNYHYSLEDLL